MNGKSVDLEHSAASDLGLHCLLRLLCPNIEDTYGNIEKENVNTMLIS